MSEKERERKRLQRLSMLENNQCDQIGRFLKVLVDKLWHKTLPKYLVTC